jgi:hypothetical protein
MRDGLDGRAVFRRRLRHRAVASFLTCAALVVPVVCQDVSEEFRLKAAFVTRFPQFVEWPADVMTGDRTFDLCVLVPNPFGGALEDLVRGELLGTRLITVRTVSQADDLGRCHVLFLPDGGTRREGVLRRIGTRPILTVSDAPRFLDEGGMVQLRLASRKVRFDVSTAAASRAGLRISSQLLRLAASVRVGPP